MYIFMLRKNIEQKIVIKQNTWSKYTKPHKFLAFSLMIRKKKNRKVQALLIFAVRNNHAFWIQNFPRYSLSIMRISYNYNWNYRYPSVFSLLHRYLMNLNLNHRSTWNKEGYIENFCFMLLSFMQPRGHDKNRLI